MCQERIEKKTSWLSCFVNLTILWHLYCKAGTTWKVQWKGEGQCNHMTLFLLSPTLTIVAVWGKSKFKIFLFGNPGFLGLTGTDCSLPQENLTWQLYKVLTCWWIFTQWFYHRLHYKSIIKWWLVPFGVSIICLLFFNLMFYYAGSSRAANMLLLSNDNSYSEKISLLGKV